MGPCCSQYFQSSESQNILLFNKTSIENNDLSQTQRGFFPREAKINIYKELSKKITTKETSSTLPPVMRNDDLNKEETKCSLEEYVKTKKKPPLMFKKRQERSAETTEGASEEQKTMKFVNSEPGARAQEKHRTVSEYNTAGKKSEVQLTQNSRKVSSTNTSDLMKNYGYIFSDENNKPRQRVRSKGRKQYKENTPFSRSDFTQLKGFDKNV